MATAIQKNPVSASPVSPKNVLLGWFTVETLLYALILILAVTLRLWNVGQYPLSNPEAEQALAAYSIYHGSNIAAPTYSPLLASLNAFTFGLFNDSDATVKLASVLLGMLLMLLPVTLRRQLGQKTCLLAAALLAVSPSAIFLSRSVNPETGTALGALMIVSGFFNWADEGRARWLYLLAGGLAVLLTAGPMAFTILVVFAITVAVRWPAFKTRWAQATERTEGSAVRNASVLLGALLVLLATAGTLNLGGFGVTTGLFSDWLSRFSFQPRPDASFNAIFLLTIYEPLLVVAGLVGLALALLNQNLFQQSMVGWFVGAMLLDLGMAGRPVGAVLLVTVPLVFLAAAALAVLWDGLARWGSWGNEGIIVGAGLVIATFGYIGLTGWILRPCDADNTFCQLAWLQAVAALVLFVVIVVFFAYMAGVGPALRGAAITGTAIGLIATLAFGWRLSHGPLMKLAFHPMAGVPPSTEVETLAQTLSSESLIRSGDNSQLDITLVGDIPATVRWQLRHFENVQRRNSRLELPATTAILTPKFEDGELNLGEAYIGQDFAVDALWSPVGLGPKDLAYWLIYRELPLHPQGNSVILWLRVGS